MIRRRPRHKKAQFLNNESPLLFILNLGSPRPRTKRWSCLRYSDIGAGALPWRQAPYWGFNQLKRSRKEERESCKKASASFS